MSYAIVFRPGAQRDLAALPRKVQARLAAEIDALAQDPRGPRTHALQGTLRGLRKVRVGDYRLAYEVDEDRHIVRIRAVGHRRDFYREILRHL